MVAACLLWDSMDLETLPKKDGAKEKQTKIKVEQLVQRGAGAGRAGQAPSPHARR